MINIAAAVGCEDDLLAPGRQPPEVPLKAGEGALCILTFDTGDGEAVGLQLEVPTRYIVKAEAGVDGRQCDWNLLLLVARTQPLEHPTGDRDVAVGSHALGIDDVAEAVVVGDVVAARHSLVAGDTDRGGDRPRGVELPAAVGVKIAAKSARGRRRSGADLVDRAVGQEPVDLKRAEAVQFAILNFDRRQYRGVDVGGDSGVAVGPELPMVWQAELESVAARQGDIGDEESRDSFIAFGDVEDRKKRQLDSE